MKMKLIIIAAVTSVALAASAHAGTRNGRNGQYYRHSCRGGGSGVSIGFGFGFPGFYGGYPGYYGYGYPYYSGYYPYGGYPYGYNPGYGYSYGYGAPNYAAQGYGDRGNVVAQVQARLARAGYYRGAVDGVMGPRTRFAIRAFEGRHGLPVDGVIDRRLLATLGLA